MEERQPKGDERHQQGRMGSVCKVESRQGCGAEVGG